MPMAQYARDHATSPYVVRLAGAMYTLQTDEIAPMEQLLRAARRRAAAAAVALTA